MIKIAPSISRRFVNLSGIFKGSPAPTTPLD